jgi:hypothetical protein
MQHKLNPEMRSNSCLWVAIKIRSLLEPRELLYIDLRRGFGIGFVPPRSALQESISIAGADVVFLHFFSHKSYVYGTPAAVGVSLRIITDGIEMGQIVPNGRKSLLLLGPVSSKVLFAAGGLAHAGEGRSSNRFLFGKASAQDVNDSASRLGQLRHVFRRHGTCIVRSVGEDHDRLFPG